MDRNEKRFEIGQRVRIIGPTAADTNIHTGKYFVIEEAKGVPWKNGPFQYCVGYSKHDSIHAWPATSLELVEPEYVSDGQMAKIDEHNPLVIAIDELLDRLDAIEQRLGSIEELIQLPEGKVDTPDDMSELRVGDYVVTVGQPLIRVGHPVGTIDCVLHILYPLGWIVLKSSGLCYPRHHLCKLAYEEIPLRREDEE